MVVCEKFEQFKEGTDFVAWACQIAYWEVRRARQKFARAKVVFDQEVVDAVAHTAAEMIPEVSARHEALAQCLQKLHAHGTGELVLTRYETGQRRRGGRPALGPVARSRLQSPRTHPQTAPRLCLESNFRGRDMKPGDPEVLEMNALCNVRSSTMSSAPAERTRGSGKCCGIPRRRGAFTCAVHGLVGQPHAIRRRDAGGSSGCAGAPVGSTVRPPGRGYARPRWPPPPAIVLAFWLGWIEGSRAGRERWRRNRRSFPAMESDESVARLSGAKDCRWSSPAIQPGDELHHGQQLKLESGFAEITFDCGAQVTLIGPATLDLDSAWGGRAAAGHAEGQRCAGGSGGFPGIQSQRRRGGSRHGIQHGGRRCRCDRGLRPERLGRDHRARRFRPRRTPRRLAREAGAALCPRRRFRGARPRSQAGEIHAQGRLRAPDAPGQLRALVFRRSHRGSTRPPPTCRASRPDWQRIRRFGIWCGAHAPGRASAGAFCNSMAGFLPGPPFSGHSRTGRAHRGLLGQCAHGGVTARDAGAILAFGRSATPDASVTIGWNRKPQYRRRARGAADGCGPRQYRGQRDVARRALASPRGGFFAQGEGPTKPDKATTSGGRVAAAAVRRWPARRRRRSSTAAKRGKGMDASQFAAEDALWIGRGVDDASGARFRGSLDELFVADAALSPQEIRHLMRENKPATPEMVAAQ